MGFRDYDNDEEVLIEIRTRKEHEATCVEEQKLVAKARGKQIFERRLEEQMLRRQVEAAGRVHYSRPPQPWDIAADLEAVHAPHLVGALARLAFAKGVHPRLASGSPAHL